MRRFTPLFLILMAFALAILSVTFYLGKATPEQQYVRRNDTASGAEQTLIKEVKPRYQLFEDDAPGSRSPQFDADLVDSRAGGSIEINLSAAVLTLDVPGADAVEEKYLFKLWPGFGAAAKALKEQNCQLLPSINAVNAKVRQFDEGMYGAIEIALAVGTGSESESISSLVRDIAAKVNRRGDAFHYLYASLEVGGFSTDALGVRPKEVDALINKFIADAAQSKPIGFYTGSRELQQTFQFMRFLQQGFGGDRTVPEEIARLFMKEEKLLKRYQRMLDIYSRLTNPLNALTPADFVGEENVNTSVGELWIKKNIGGRHTRTGIYFLPYAVLPETLLIERTLGEGFLTSKPDPILQPRRFARGPAKDAKDEPAPEPDTIALVVEAIRDGKVDLAPTEKSGWYDYQVYSLEALLVPARGGETEKLLLSARYKQRLMEVFQADVTRVPETQMQNQTAKSEKDPPARAIYPRLRVEPAPTYFLRHARAYGFLRKTLPSLLPEGLLGTIKGVMEGGRRSLSVADELIAMQRLLYGLHLIACEDIGLRPQFNAGEVADPAACIQAATEWLEHWTDDPDLAMDARSSVPIYVNARENRAVLWNHIGVRGAILRAGYDQLPRWRRKGEANWSAFEQGESSNYVLLVDEFASTPRPNLSVLNREELRKLCDREKNREAIIDALKR